MHAKAPSPPLTRASLLLAIILVMGSLAPMLGRISPWISLVAYAVLGWRLLQIWRQRDLAPRWLRLILTLLALLLALRHSNTLTGSDWGLALLTLMMALKVFESKTQRDLYVLVVLAFFYTVAQFVYVDSMEIALFHLGLTAGYLALLVQHHQPQTSLTAPRTRHLILTLLAQAIPLGILLFVLFPRLSAPLWNLHLEHTVASTGLSDRVAPGSIAELIRSGTPAFRAEFSGPPPQRDQLYWRGPVFTETDGFEWHLDHHHHPAPLPVQSEATPLRYWITQEPLRQRWRYALDLPVTAPPEAFINQNFQLIGQQPLFERQRFGVESALAYRTPQPEPGELAEALKLPNNITPRMSTLIEQWQLQAEHPLDIARQALEYFRSQPFVYTLQPPLLGRNPADEFLFETRKGFCEHYATSFTILMRLAQIPSRLVTGYQGGEFNEIGHYFLIRQSDAHAWSEIWVDDRGWVRIDPTAAVAPERIEHALDVNALETGLPARFQLFEGSGFYTGMRQLRQIIDAINTGWNRWVLDYTYDRQRSLMRFLRFDFFDRYSEWTLSLLLMAGTLTATLLLMRRKQQLPTDPVRALYERLRAKLRAAGLALHPAEGPWHLCLRAGRTFPAERHQLLAIGELYLRLRYREAPQPELLSALRAQVRRLKLRRHVQPL